MKPAVKTRLYLAAGLLLLSLSAAASAAQRCLFVSSYHQGYAWSDGVQKGIEDVLQGRCELRQFDMDTKRRKSPEEKKEAALVAKAVIDEWKPHVVITADDNAARYLIVPYYKDAETPFVFCGVNWSVEEYGFPFSNVTGMIEVAPIRPMLQQAQELASGTGDVFYLGADTATEKKNLARFEEAAADMGLSLKSRLVDSLQDWLQAYADGQSSAFIVIGSHAGIADWDFKAAADAIEPGVLTVSNHEWMMPVSMLGFTKLPEEQGRWAAEAALAILEGVPAGAIPIIANQRWDIWVNPAQVERAGITLPGKLLMKAKQVRQPG